MPQIPIAQRPDMAFTQDIGPQPVSPAGWRSLPSNFAQSAESSAAEMIQGIGAAASGILNAGAEFLKKSQDAADYDAFHEARRFAKTEFDKFHSDIQTRTDYDNFEKDYLETAKRVDEGVKPFLDKAGNHAKRVISQDIADMSADMGVNTRAIGRQRKIIDLKNSAVNQINWYVDHDDIAGASARIAEADKSGLLFPGEVEQLKNNVQERQECNNIAKSIDSGNAGIVFDQLKERDESGKYKNFGKLSEKSRLALLGYADRKKTEYENNVKDSLVEMLNNGELTEDVINSYPIKQGVKNELIKSVRQQSKEFWADVEKEAESVLKEQEAAWTDEAESLAFDIVREEWSDKPEDRQKQYGEYQDKILSLNVDEAKKKTLWMSLKSSFEAKEKPDSSYQSGFVYKAMVDMLKKSYDAGRFKVMLKDRTWPIFNVYSDEAEQKIRHVELLQKMDEMFKENPDISMEAAVKWGKEQLDALQSGKVKTFVESKFSPAIGRISARGETFRLARLRQGRAQGEAEVRTFNPPVAQNTGDLNPGEVRMFDKSGKSYIVDKNTKEVLRAE